MKRVETTDITFPQLFYWFVDNWGVERLAKTLLNGLRENGYSVIARDPTEEEATPFIGELTRDSYVSETPMLVEGKITTYTNGEVTIRGRISYEYADTYWFDRVAEAARNYGFLYNED